jgi:ribosomal protein S12 methylthiotransferase accessory factor
MSEVYADWQRTRPRNPDLLADVHYLRDVLAEAGHDVIVVDQTSPEQRLAGLHTACVIVPGLIPIDFGWWRQRGLNMPRTLTAFRRAGWRSTDLDPADLNRVPHPFP